MPVYKDKERNTFYCKFYYTDYTGTKKQKIKRGFKLQRDAKAWERAFLERQQGSPDMTFQSLYELYIEDMSARLRETTLAGKKYLYESHILPYFKDKPINQITAADVRKWQNTLISGTNKKGEPYSQTYIKTINNQMVACLNYAMKYYNLPRNPCHVAGSIGKKNADEMQFWTLREFKQFITVVDDPKAHATFMTLYYTGIRIGELLALTSADIDKDTCTVSITKSYANISGQVIISEPKTPKSKRVIVVPPALIEELQHYMSMIYGLKSTDRLFDTTKHSINRWMIKYCEASSVKKIRLHDIRHSHASLLIELGFSPLLIADRLGHEKVETTLNIYSHLYPHKQTEVSNKLQELIIVSN